MFAHMIHVAYGIRMKWVFFVFTLNICIVIVSTIVNDIIFITVIDNMS